MVTPFSEVSPVPHLALKVFQSVPHDPTSWVIHFPQARWERWGRPGAHPGLSCPGLHINTSSLSLTMVSCTLRFPICHLSRTCINRHFVCFRESALHQSPHRTTGTPARNIGTSMLSLPTTLLRRRKWSRHLDCRHDPVDKALIGLCCPEWWMCHFSERHQNRIKSPLSTACLFYGPQGFRRPSEKNVSSKYQAISLPQTDPAFSLWPVPSRSRRMRSIAGSS